ncbi:MAG: efflux RND transporter permease subunit [Saprospirales bacterium]|nr:efflux RND transporter permease subunit [Saprospirales bacterium]
MINFLITNSLKNRLFVLAAALGLFAWGIYSVRNNPIDAIPDLSENQVIVFTEWMGRSPQLIEDQVTYPLVSNLQGIPQVKISGAPPCSACPSSMSFSRIRPTSIGRARGYSNGSTTPSVSCRPAPCRRSAPTVPVWGIFSGTTSTHRVWTWANNAPCRIGTSNLPCKPYRALAKWLLSAVLANNTR